MNLNELKPASPRRTKKRVGRGESSGWGKSAGRGGSGQTARSGASIHPSFEGGQTPFFRRIPKKGFTNYPFKKFYTTFNISDIDKRYEAGETVDRESLIAKGMLKRKEHRIKILGVGELKKRLSFKVDKLSEAARDKILASEGEIFENAQ